MQYPVPAYTSFTIPTGATTGQRITFNEFGDGVIRVYNSSGVLVDTIGGPSGEIRSTNGTNYVALNGGNIFLALNTVPESNAGQIQGAVPGAISMLSPRSAPLPDGLAFSLFSGTDGQSTGSVNAPFAVLADADQTSSADLLLSGSVIKTLLNGARAQWQPFSFVAGWAGATAIGGLGGSEALKFRFTAENEVWLYGLATTSAGAPMALGTLPAGYFNTTFTTFGSATRHTSGAYSPVPIAIATNGVVISSVFPAAGDEWLFNFTFPIGNLP